MLAVRGTMRMLVPKHCTLHAWRLLHAAAVVSDQRMSRRGKHDTVQLPAVCAVQLHCDRLRQLVACIAHVCFVPYIVINVLFFCLIIQPSGMGRLLLAHAVKYGLHNCPVSIRGRRRGSARARGLARLFSPTAMAGQLVSAEHKDTWLEFWIAIACRVAVDFQLSI